MIDSNVFKYLRMTYPVCLLIAISMASFKATSDEIEHTSNHKGHSDALLVLLKEKIAITELQSKFEALLETSEKKRNLDKQGMKLVKAMHVIQPYVAIPESRYPNMEMYHQSLISRGELMEEFAKLMLNHQKQTNSILFTK